MRARQKVSRAGVELIKSFEGLRQTAARLPDGRWTIGYGHTFSAREGARVTQEDADALLRFDLLPIVDSLNNMVLVPLNQNQFDALVSFAFNIGVDNFAPSNVLKRINEGRMTEAALAMDAWRSAEFNGQTYVLAPLIRRRAAEKNLFLTPEEGAGTAPSLLVRPTTDTQPDAGLRPTELDAPDRGGVLSAYPAGEPQVAQSPYTPPMTPQPAPQPVAPLSPYAATYAPQPVAAPIPEAAPTSYDRQVIDLGDVTPRPLPEMASAAPQPAAPQLQPSDISPYPPATGFSPYASPYAQSASAPAPVAAPSPAAEPPVVEMLPGGFATPSPSAPQPAPVQPEPPAPTSYDPAFGGEPVMSPEVAAALARAQDEQRQREEAQTQAAAFAAQAAARAAEEARIRDLQQAEAARLEAQRQEQDRIDRARIEAERAEAARQEQLRLDQERQAREQAEAARLEQERQAREAQANAERERAEMARLEQERLDRERSEQAQLEQARLEQERQARERTEQEARTAAAVAAAAVPAADDDAEKARKADAAAALMRLYSPYGGGPLGRPLNIGTAPLTPTPAQPASDTAPGPKPEAPQAAAPEPEAAQLPVDVGVSQVTPERFPVAGEPAVFTPHVESQNDEDDDIANFKPFTPIMSAANLPAPVITALNPYAQPLPKESVRDNPIAPIAEAPPMAPIMPAAVTPAAFEPVRDAAPDQGLHWRDRLQRPLPEGNAAPAAPAFARDDDQPQRQSNLRPAFMADDETDDAWMHDGRVAMSVEEMEANTVSWWKMLTSTLWGICLSIVGIVSLGVAAGAYYKSKDLSVIRNGLQQDWGVLSIISAVIGCVIVGISMWLMMRRLGGLEEK